MTAVRLRPIVALAAVALALAGCAPAEHDMAYESTAPTDSAPTTAPPPETTPTPESTDGAEVALDCTTLLAPASVSQLEQAGWTSKQGPFVIADTELSGGIQCMWAESANASGNVLLFAWAPIEAELAATLEAKLVSAGMTREETADGVYVSEPAQTGTDAQGAAGFSYLFGDGWVVAGDSRDSLSLIQRP